MKTTLKLIAALLVANLAVYALASEDNQSVAAPETDKIAEASGYTDIMDIPVEKLTCKAGGPNSSECKIPSGIKIGNFVSSACSVACDDGYYACCGVGCICKPYK